MHHSGVECGNHHEEYTGEVAGHFGPIVAEVPIDTSHEHGHQCLTYDTECGESL